MMHDFRHRVEQVAGRYRELCARRDTRQIDDNGIRKIVDAAAELLQGADARVLFNCLSGGMGHLAHEPAWYLAHQALHGSDAHKGPTILILKDGQAANEYLLRLWETHFLIFRCAYANRLLKAAAIKTGRGCDIGGVPFPELPHGPEFTRQRNRRYARMMKEMTAYKRLFGSAILSPPQELTPAGRQALIRLGVKPDQWFVCLHASEVTTDARWSYDPFRRNRLTDYSAAIRRITAKGGAVIRMGHPALTPAPADLPVIDYPLSAECSPWMDIFLISNCRFFLGSQSGPHVVASIFGRPKLLANMVPWQMINAYAGDLYLIKPIVERGSGRRISLEEYLTHHLDFAQWGLPEEYTVVPNSDADLVAATDEMSTILDTGWPVRPSALQMQWVASLPQDSQCALSEARIADSFIARHADELLKNGRTRTIRRPPESVCDGSNLVFIVGAPRSGTTWLQRLLAGHPQLKTGQESDLFDMFVGPQLKAWKSLMATDKDMRPVGLPSYMHFNEFRQILHDYLKALLTPMLKDLAEGMLFLEKTPSHALFVAEILEMLPKSRIIHLIRDPRDVTASLLAAARTWGRDWAPASPEGAARMWLEHISAAMHGRKATGRNPYTEIRYEDLYQHTAPTLKEVMTFLELPWPEDKMREAIERNTFDQCRRSGGTTIQVGGEMARRHGSETIEPQGFFRKGKVGAWREDLDIHALRAVQSIAGDAMQALGYPLDDGIEPRSAAETEREVASATVGIEAAMRVLERTPDDVDALLRIAQLMEANGNPDQARCFIKEVLILDPENVQAIKCQNRLVRGMS